MFSHISAIFRSWVLCRISLLFRSFICSKVSFGGIVGGRLCNMKWRLGKVQGFLLWLVVGGSRCKVGSGWFNPAIRANRRRSYDSNPNPDPNPNPSLRRVPSFQVGLASPNPIPPIKTTTRQVYHKTREDKRCLSQDKTRHKQDQNNTRSGEKMRRRSEVCVWAQGGKM